MKKILGLFLVAIAAFALAACGEKKVEATGYGLVHKHYVGEVKVTVKGDKILEMSIEEYYLPYNLGAVDSKLEESTDSILVIATEKDGKTSYKRFAKFILVDSVLYTAENKEGNISYVNNSNKDIEEVVKDEASAKAYVEALKAEKVFIVDNADAKTKSTTIVSTKKNIDKTTDKYWSADMGVGLGWAKNMEEMSNAFIKYGVDAKFTQNGESKLWETVDGATGATVVDFLDYQAVAKRAVANAK